MKLVDISVVILTGPCPGLRAGPASRHHRKTQQGECPPRQSGQRNSNMSNVVPTVNQSIKQTPVHADPSKRADKQAGEVTKLPQRGDPSDLRRSSVPEEGSLPPLEGLGWVGSAPRGGQHGRRRRGLAGEKSGKRDSGQGVEAGSTAAGRVMTSAHAVPREGHSPLCSSSQEPVIPV